jgi:Tfp pilus assembly protein PilX
MHKFSTRNMLILVIGLVLAVVLIGLGVAHVVQLKQRVLWGNSNDALTGRAQTAAWGNTAVTLPRS